MPKAPAKDGREANESPGLSIGSCSLIGHVREFNDDAVAVKELPGATLLLIADGMGGKIGERVLGQIACARAFEVITRELGKDIPGAGTANDIRNAIRRAIVTANADVIAAAGKDTDLQNMGATIVVALWRPGDGMYVAGIGDCRAYLVRDKKIEQLAVDHSLAQALVEAKTITAEEARTHRFRNVLWKYLGSKEVGDGPEVKRVSLLPLDRLVLCTKGVHGALSDEQILAVTGKRGEAQKCADALCNSALDAGSRGNASSMVVEVLKKD